MAIEDGYRIMDRFDGTSGNILGHVTEDGSNWLAAKGPFATASASQMTVASSRLTCAPGVQNAVRCTRSVRSPDQLVHIEPVWPRTESGSVYLLARWDDTGAYPSGYAVKITRVAQNFFCWFQRYYANGSNNLDLQGYGGVALPDNSGTSFIIEFSLIADRLFLSISGETMNFLEGSSTLLRAGLVGFAMEMNNTTLLMDTFGMRDAPAAAVPAFWTDFVESYETDIAELLAVPQTTTAVVVREPITPRIPNSDWGDPFLIDNFSGSTAHNILTHTSDSGGHWVAAKGPFAVADASQLLVSLTTLKCTAGFSNAVLSTTPPTSPDQNFSFYPQWPQTETSDVYFLLRWIDSPRSGYAVKITRVASNIRFTYQKYNADGSSNLDLMGLGGVLVPFGAGTTPYIEINLTGGNFSLWMAGQDRPEMNFLDTNPILQTGSVGFGVRSDSVTLLLDTFYGYSGSSVLPPGVSSFMANFNGSGTLATYAPEVGTFAYDNSRSVGAFPSVKGGVATDVVLDGAGAFRVPETLGHTHTLVVQSSPPGSTYFTNVDFKIDTARGVALKFVIYGRAYTISTDRWGGLGFMFEMFSDGKHLPTDEIPGLGSAGDPINVSHSETYDYNVTEPWFTGPTGWMSSMIGLPTQFSVRVEWTGLKISLFINNALIRSLTWTNTTEFTPTGVGIVAVRSDLDLTPDYSAVSVSSIQMGSSYVAPPESVFWTDFVKAEEQTMDLLRKLPLTDTPVVVRAPTVGVITPMSGSETNGMQLFMNDFFDRGAADHSPLVHTSNYPGGTTWIAAKGPFATVDASQLYINGSLLCNLGKSGAILSTAVPFSADHMVSSQPTWPDTITGALYFLIRWDETGANASGYALKVQREVGDSTRFRSWFQRYSPDGNHNFDMSGTGGTLHDYGLGTQILIQFYMIGNKLYRWVTNTHTAADELVDTNPIMQVGRVGIAMVTGGTGFRYMPDVSCEAFPAPVLPTLFWTDYIKAYEVDA